MMWGPEGYLIQVDYRSDFVAGSGMSVGGQLGSVGANLAIVGFLLLGVLAIIAKFLEWGEGDTNPNGLLMILARAGFLAILGGIISTLIQSL